MYASTPEPHADNLALFCSEAAIVVQLQLAIDYHCFHSPLYSSRISSRLAVLHCLYVINPIYSIVIWSVIQGVEEDSLSIDVGPDGDPSA